MTIAEEQVRAFTEHVATWPPDRRERVVASRPDVLGPAGRGAARRGGAAGLVDRLIAPEALATVATTLPLGPTQVLIAVLLAGESTRERLASLLATSQELLAACLEHLLDRALVWDDGDQVRPAPRLRRHVQPPEPLGPIAEEVVEQLTGTEADAALRKLGVRVRGPKNRQASLAALHAALVDEAQVRAVVAAAPPRVRKALTARFAVARRDDATPDGMLHEQESLRWAEQHGLAFRNRRGGYGGYGGWETGVTSPYDVFGLYSFGPSLPREVVLALRPDGVTLPFEPVRPDVPVHAVSSDAVSSASTAALHELTAVATALVDEVDRSAVPLLRSGGVGVREVRRLAKLLTADEAAVRFALDLLGVLGLLTDEHGTLLAGAGGAGLVGETAHVSADGGAWRERDPAARGLSLATAWLASHDHLTEPEPSGKVRPPLLPTAGCVGCASSRTALLRALAHLGPLEGTAVEDIAPAVRWELPSAHAGHDPAATPYGWAWHEAQRVGLIAEGALAPLGRLLLAGDAEGALHLLGGALPASVDEVLFGADLTAIVPGDPAAGVSRLLDSCADREGRGGAVVWRLSPGSVRRALDQGAGADGLLHRMEAVAAGGTLPQPLVYLVRDVARTHGLLRVRPAVSVLRCPDEPLLAQVCADRALSRLGLVRIAPTVATTAAPPEQVLTALRAAGYLPMPEGAGSAVDLAPVTRPARTPDAGVAEPPVESVAEQRQTPPRARPPRPAAAPRPPDRLEEHAPQLEPEERQLLLAALEGDVSAGSTVEVEYVTVVGTRSRRRLASLRLIGEEAGKASLRARSVPDGEERTFRLDRIVAVHPVAPSSGPG